VVSLYIKNTSQLLISGLSKNQLYLRKIALEAIEKSITAVKPKNLIEKWVIIENTKLHIFDDEYDLENFGKVYIIGGGKATAEMAFTLEKIMLNAHITEYEGIINIPEGTSKPEDNVNSKISLNYASHPIPNENGLRGAKMMMQIIENANDNDLIIMLISGGGSALLPFPRDDITLKDLQNINSLLLASGASIQEINTIRKHISNLKGGNLAKKLFNSSNATLISLIISDVIGDNLDSIASGPTVPDTTTFKDALDILKKYRIFRETPSSIKKYLEKGLIAIELENPKPHNICFTNVHNYLIGSVKSAVQEITSFLEQNKFNIEFFSSEVRGEAQEFGISLYNMISCKIEQKPPHDKNSKLALIGTGELTVTIKGNGIGGRNQEMLLSFLNYAKDKKLNAGFLILGVNLDGIEGNSKAMGALIDNNILNQLDEMSIDLNEFLKINDSNRFFKVVQCEIITGLTGCNVNDLILILISR